MPGQGIPGVVEGHAVVIGTAAFVAAPRRRLAGRMAPSGGRRGP